MPLPDPHLGVGDLDPDFWREALALFAFGAVSPWLSMVDLDKYGRCVDRVQSLDISTVACCYSPVIEGPLIERAFAHVRQLPALDPAPAARSVRARPGHRRDLSAQDVTPPSDRHDQSARCADAMGWSTDR